MSVAVQCIGFDCPSFLTGASSAGFDVGSSNRIVNRTDEKICQLRERVSMTLGRPLDEALASLREIYRECFREDWDGYGAAAITYNAYKEAEKVIKLMPTSIHMPEITAEPTGGIGLEWYRDKSQVFVISVDGKHRIAYAGIFGTNKIHGTEHLEETLPLVIIEHLRRLYS
jgi:hypothetical protein